MTQNANSFESTTGHHNGDGIRRRAYEEAMARLSGRSGVARSVSQVGRQYILSYEGPVVAGDLGKS